MAVEKAADAAASTAKGAWGVTKFVGKNLTPLGNTGRIVWGVGLTAAAFSVAAAPPIAWEAANQITINGFGNLAGTFADLAMDGAPVLWDIGEAVIETLPGAWESAQTAASNTVAGTTGAAEVTKAVTTSIIPSNVLPFTPEATPAPALATPPPATMPPYQPPFDPNSMFSLNAA